MMLPDHAWRLLDRMCRDERVRLSGIGDPGTMLQAMAAFDSLDEIERLIPSHIAAAGTIADIDGPL